MIPDVKPPGGPVKQFSIFLENKCGALIRLVRLLDEAHVSVLGLSMLDATDVTIARLVVSDPETVEQVFYERGVPFRTSELVVVDLPDGPTGLSACLQVLLEAETNILFAYPLLNQPGGHTLLALALEDTVFGSAVLQQSGFKILYQEDLSR